MPRLIDSCPRSWCLAIVAIEARAEHAKINLDVTRRPRDGLGARRPDAAGFGQEPEARPEGESQRADPDQVPV